MQAVQRRVFAQSRSRCAVLQEILEFDETGDGIYRMEDSWYPVQAGDAIWMTPYCAQWFVAMGKTPASYLYYKDVNRAAL